MQCPWRPKKGISSIGTVDTDCWGGGCLMWELGMEPPLSHLSSFEDSFLKIMKIVTIGEKVETEY